MGVHDIDLTEENRVEIEHTNHSFREFEYLVTSHQVEVRELVAKNPNLPVEYARMMMMDVIVQVRVALASNANLSREIVESLAREEKIPVLIAVARHPKLDPSRIDHFASHKSHAIRDAVASNSSAPIHILKKLSVDTEWGVRRSVATNQNATTEILLSLIENGTYHELSAIGKNLNSSKEVLDKLFKRVTQSQDRQLKSILEDIIGHRNYPEKSARDIYDALLQAEKDKQARATEDFELSVAIDRKAVASRMDLSSEFINVLLQDPNEQVRETLGANALIPDEMLSQLALDSEESVRTAVYRNPKSSAETKATALLLGIKKGDDDN